MRLATIALIAGSLALTACEDSGTKDLVLADGGTGAGGQGGTTGEGGGGESGDLDSSVGQDARTSDSEVNLPGDASVDMSPADPDAGLDPGLPRYSQVATASVRQDTFVSWVQDDALMLRVFDAQGIAGETATVLTGVGDADIVGLGISGVPWFAFGADGEAVRAFQADVPSDIYELGVFGPPLIAAAESSAVILGVDEIGANAFHILRANDLPADVQPPEVDPVGLPFPDHIIGIRNALVMRHGDAGQCSFLDLGGAALGNFPCQTGAGRFIGDGSRALATIDIVAEDELRLAVRPVFASASAIYEALARVAPFDRFQNDGLERPVVGGGRMNNDGTRPFQVSIMAVDGLWRSESMDTWDYPGVRAIVSKQTGEDREAWLLDFDTPNPPSLTRLPVSPVEFNGAPYEIEIDAECTPTYERCDGVDEDCDREVDNGLCCDAGDDSGVDAWVDFDQPPLELLVADVNRMDQHRVAVRTNEDRWVIYSVRRNNRGNSLLRASDCRATPCDEAFECNRETGICARRDPPVEGKNFYREPVFTGAYKGHALVSAGGYVALIADDADDNPTVFWFHSSTGLFTDTELEARGEAYRHVRLPVKPPHRMPCDNAFAVDTISHDTVDASIVVFCEDRIVRVFPHEGVPDEEYRFDHPAVDWATVTRVPSAAADPKQLKVLVKYTSDDAEDQGLVAYNYTDRRNLTPPRLPIPPSLAARPKAELRDPIWLHAGFQKSPVQIGADFQARVLVSAGGQTSWQDIVTATDPSRTEYARLARRVITSAVLGEGDARRTHWWLVDVNGKRGVFNLWSTRSAFSEAGDLLGGGANPEPLWTITQGDYTDNIVMLTSPANNDPEAPNRWHLKTRVIDCKDL